MVLARPGKAWQGRSKGSFRRISSLGALGEGSGWDLKIRPAPAPPAPASGNLGMFHGKMFTANASRQMFHVKCSRQNVHSKMLTAKCSRQNVLANYSQQNSRQNDHGNTFMAKCSRQHVLGKMFTATFSMSDSRFFHVQNGSGTRALP